MSLQPVLTFDGVDDYIEIPYSEKHNSKIFTISCWVKFTKQAYQHFLNARALSPSNQGYFLLFNSTKYYFTIANSIVENRSLEAKSIPILNVWTHFAGTYDGSKAIFYINGKVECETIEPRQPFLVNTHGSVYIGASNATKILVECFLEGQIAEVCIWNKARTQQEIQSDMHKRLTGKEEGLVGYWPLNEGSGNTAIDKTSNGKNGIIKGGATWKQEEIPLNPAEPTTEEFQVSTTLSNQQIGIIDPLDADRKRGNWHKVTFDVPFEKGKRVVVIPMTQTYAGNNTPGLRLQNVTNLGFEIRFDELVGIGDLSNGNHQKEIVGWVAHAF
jgi:hypothetical protein